MVHLKLCEYRDPLPRSYNDHAKTEIKQKLFVTSRNFMKFFIGLIAVKYIRAARKEPNLSSHCDVIELLFNLLWGVVTLLKFVEVSLKN